MSSELLTESASVYVGEEDGRILAATVSITFNPLLLSAKLVDTLVEQVQTTISQVVQEHLNTAGKDQN